MPAETWWTCGSIRVFTESFTTGVDRGSINPPQLEPPLFCQRAGILYSCKFLHCEFQDPQQTPPIRASPFWNWPVVHCIIFQWKKIGIWWFHNPESLHITHHSCPQAEIISFYLGWLVHKPNLLKIFCTFWVGKRWGGYDIIRYSHSFLGMRKHRNKQDWQETYYKKKQKSVGYSQIFEIFARMTGCCLPNG